MARSRRSPAADAAVVLLVVAAVWGSMFPVAKELLRDLPADDYVAERALCASVALLVIRPKLLKSIDWRMLRAGVFLGTVYGACQVLQFEGLARSSVASTAFVLSLFVVIVPILMAVVNRKLPDRPTLVGVVLAGTGIACMVYGSGVNVGVIIALVAALGYSVHIVALGLLARPGDAFALTLVQMVTMAILGLAFASRDGIGVPSNAVGWWSLAYLGIVAGAAAMVAQVWAQARMSASQTSILLVTEPVWATGFAMLFFGERNDLRTLMGAVLILAATMLVLVRPTGRDAVIDEETGELRALPPM